MLKLARVFYSIIAVSVALVITSSSYAGEIDSLGKCSKPEAAYVVEPQDSVAGEQSPQEIVSAIVQHCAGLPEEEVFDTLKEFTASIPISVCWLDTNNVPVGLNQRCLEDIGGTPDDFIGKTMHELYPAELADKLAQHNNEVMRTGQRLIGEGEVEDAVTGKMKYFNIYKAPLYDNSGKLIGIVGVSVETTAEKNAELLNLRDEL